MLEATRSGTYGERPAGARRVSRTGRARVLDGLRAVIVAGEPGPTRGLAAELGACGAVVRVVDARGRGLEAARQIDPEVALIDPAALAGAGAELSRRLADDPRLRWAAVARVRYGTVWPGRLGELEQVVAPLVLNDRLLREHAAAGRAFECDVARLGPNRTLRAVEPVTAPLRVTGTSAGAVAEVVLAGELVVSASWWEAGPASARLSGIDALAAFLTMRRGRIEVRPCVAMTGANVLAPVGEALSRASRQMIGVTAGAATVRAPRATAAPPPDFDDELTTKRFARHAASCPRPALETEDDDDIATGRRVAVRPQLHSGVSPMQVRSSLGWVALAAGVLVAAVGVAVAIQPGRGGVAEAETENVTVTAAETEAETGAAAETGAEAEAETETETETVAGAETVAETETGAGAETEGVAGAGLDLPAGGRRAARVLVERARELGTTREAERLFRLALERHPSSPRAMAGIAEIELRRGQAAEAVEWARDAIALSPRRASYHVLLGDALDAAGDPEGALEAWERADRLAPGRPFIERRLGR